MNTLRAAAELVLAAPSIFNTQPWSWVVHPDRLVLRADRQRHLPAVDPDGRLLTISCGVALHHGVTALAPAAVEVQLMPDTADTDVLATLRLRPDSPPDHTQSALRAAIKRRRTDRRTFARAYVSADTIGALIAACEQQHAHLHVVESHQNSRFALAAVRAGALSCRPLQRPGWAALPSVT